MGRSKMYLVLLGCAWRETDQHRTDRDTLIRDVVSGDYTNPAENIGFQSER
jgi:hypothetical protein